MTESPTKHVVQALADGAQCSCGRKFRAANTGLAITNAKRHAASANEGTRSVMAHRRAVKVNREARKAALDRLVEWYWSDYVRFYEEEKEKRGIISRRKPSDQQKAARELRRLLGRRPELAEVLGPEVRPEEPMPEVEVLPAPTWVPDDPDPLAPPARRRTA